MARQSTPPPNQPQQVNVTVKKKRPRWQWIGLGVIVLFVCAGLSNLVNPRPTTTNQAGVVTQSTATSVTFPTETIAQAITEPTSPPVLEPTPPVLEPTPEPTLEPPTAIPPTLEPTLEPATAIPPTAITLAGPRIVPRNPPDPLSGWTASAFVDPINPVTPNGSVRITGKLLKDGKPFPGAIMNLSLAYKSTTTRVDGAKTNADGTEGQTVQIGRASVGYEVKVRVTFLVDDKVVATTNTAFTPR